MIIREGETYETFEGREITVRWVGPTGIVDRIAFWLSGRRPETYQLDWRGSNGYFYNSNGVAKWAPRGKNIVARKVPVRFNSEDFGGT